VTAGRHADSGLIAGSHTQSINPDRSSIATSSCTHLDATPTSLVGRTLTPVRVVAPRCNLHFTHVPSQS